MKTHSIKSLLGLIIPVAKNRSNIAILIATTSRFKSKWSTTLYVCMVENMKVYYIHNKNQININTNTNKTTNTNHMHGVHKTYPFY